MVFRGPPRHDPLNSQPRTATNHRRVPAGRLVLVSLAAQLRQGKNWARVALAVLYGGIGTLSLVVGPVTWLAEGGSLADAVAAANLGSVLFAASRVVHLGAVIAALILMFHPAASAYLRATTRAPARHGTQQERGRRHSQMIDVAEHPAALASSQATGGRLASHVRAVHRSRSTASVTSRAIIRSTTDVQRDAA